MLSLDSSAAAPACVRRPAAAPALSRLQEVMASGRFVTYQPTSLQVINGQPTRADADSIRLDLQALRSRFDGLITYRANHGAEQIADIAASLGYRALIIGIWDVNDPQELAQALRTASRHPQLVVGVSLGNERVFAGQFSFEELAKLLQNLRRRAPQLALTTTEPFAWLLRPTAATIFPASDFMLVNIHPIFESWFHDAPDRNAAQFVVNVVDRLAAVSCGPVLVKETGVPTSPAAGGYTPARQAGFYGALQQAFPRSKIRAFAYFSAFDAPWRANDVSPVAGAHPEEAHWGLYDEQRVPKPVVQAIPPLGR
jgi:exo-beta-1,3-glucanase (GH17 family)